MSKDYLQHKDFPYNWTYLHFSIDYRYSSGYPDFVCFHNFYHNSSNSMFMALNFERGNFNEQAKKYRPIRNEA